MTGSPRHWPRWTVSSSRDRRTATLLVLRNGRANKHHGHDQTNSSRLLHARKDESNEATKRRQNTRPISIRSGNSNPSLPCDDGFQIALEIPFQLQGGQARVSREKAVDRADKTVSDETYGDGRKRAERTVFSERTN